MKQRETTPLLIPSEIIITITTKEDPSTRQTINSQRVLRISVRSNLKRGTWNVKIIFQTGKLHDFVWRERTWIFSALVKSDGLVMKNMQQTMKYCITLFWEFFRRLSQETKLNNDENTKVTIPKSRDERDKIPVELITLEKIIGKSSVGARRMSSLHKLSEWFNCTFK